MMNKTPGTAIVVGVILLLVTTQACNAQARRIRGGSTVGNAAGQLSVLTLESPDGEVVVAVKYPKPIDTTWYPGYGSSGNGDDAAQWEDVSKVRFKEGDTFVELIVGWKYSSRTRKLTFGGKEFDLPPGKLAVLSYDNDRKPLCELLDDTPANMKGLRSQFENKYKEAIPTTPAP